MKARLSLLILILALSLLPSWARAEDDGPVAPPAADPQADPSPPASSASPPNDAARRALPETRLPTVGPLANPAAAEVPALPEPSLSPPRVVYKRRYNLALFGGALLLASYTADRLLMGDLSKSGFAWIPLAGPWFLLDLQIRQPVPNSATVLFLAIDGLLQAGGLTMTVLGLVLRERRQTVRLLAPAASLRPIPSTGIAP
jgi:hypothetical protein